MFCVSRGEEKTTVGWVVNGGRRHAGQQGDLIPRGHTNTLRVANANKNTLLINNTHALCFFFILRVMQAISIKLFARRAFLMNVAVRRSRPP